MLLCSIVGQLGVGTKKDQPLGLAFFVNFMEVGDSAIAVHIIPRARVYKRSLAICLSPVATPPNWVSLQATQ
jgi:hypothetical protein